MRCHKRCCESLYGGWCTWLHDGINWVQRHIQNPVKHLNFCKNSLRLFAINYFRKRHHCKCLISPWIRLWSVHNKMTIFDLLHKALITILKNCEVTSKQGWWIFFRYLKNGHRDNIFHYNSPACFWWKSYNNFSFFCSWEIYESSTLFHCWLWVK